MLKLKDESVVGVALKEETDGRFTQSYIEDICPATFGKVFLPIDSHEVDFTDEMVKLELESQSGEHHIWAAQLATTTLCEQDDCGIHGNPGGVESAPESSGRDSAVEHEDTVKEDEEEEEEGREEQEEEEEEEEASSSLSNEASVDRDSDKDRRDDEDTTKPDDNATGSKFYKIQCTICKKWFLNNDSMITHLRNHCGGSGVVPTGGEQCQVCQQTFHDGASLHAHMLSHVGANPIECNLCQKRFAYKWCLRNHATPSTTTSAANPTGKTFDNCCPSGSGNVLVVGSENVGILPGGVYAYESVEQARKLYEDRTGSIDDVNRAKDNKAADNETRNVNRCDICRTRFKDRESLERHAIVHANEATTYKYDLYASTLFRDKVDMPRVATHPTTSKQFKCALCERSFSQRTALNNHMLAHSGEKPHACNICEKTYKRKSELIRHTMVHTGERPYECKECLMTFREKAKLNSHMLVHTGEKPHECYICHKACARKSDLNSHMLSHTGGQYDCKVCDKIFTRKSDLNRHTLIHTGEKPFACEHCDMAFRERTRLNSHMLVHTGDKRHACHICGKSFREKSSLRKHMLVHTGDRPYECYICKKSFTQKTTLNSHVLVHTGGRGGQTSVDVSAPGGYECDSCPKSFREKSSLRKHSLFHANERVHECNVCFKKFPHKAALGTHAAIEHPS